MIDELDLVRMSMDSVPLPAAEVVERLRRGVATLVELEGEARAPARRFAPLAARRNRLALAGVALTAAVLAVVFFLPTASDGPAAASAALRHLAQVAAAQPSLDAPGPGQYEYTESVAAYRHCLVRGASSSGLTGIAGARAAAAAQAGGVAGYCALIPEHRQIWIGPDNSGRLIESFGAPEFTSPADRAAWVAGDSPSFPEPFAEVTDSTYGPHALSDGPTDLASLPTDPGTLAARIDARAVEGGPPGPAEDFTQIGDLLRETDASPALRSALYEVAADLPGVNLLGTVDDHAGRPGIGIGYVTGGIRQELIFDPSSSALLGEESVAVEDDPPGYTIASGTVVSWTTYLSSGIVDALDATPTGSVPPAPPVTCTANRSPASSTGSSGAARAIACAAGNA